MATSLKLSSWRSQRPLPLTHRESIPPRRVALWPTFSIVFLLCLPVLFTPIAVTVLNAALLSIAIVVALVGNRRIDPVLLVVTFSVAVVACLGFITGREADRYEYFKDAWYVSNPILVMLVGYIFYVVKPDLGGGLRAFVIAGFLVACWQLRGYFFDPSLIFLPAVRIRQLIGTGSYVPVVALVIMLICWGKWHTLLRLPTWLASTLFLVAIISVVGVFSRSALVVVGIGLAAQFGCFGRREWLRIGAPIFLLMVLSYIAQVSFDINSDRALQSFGGKLIRSVQELTSGDGSSARDINLNFRAFETEQALTQFSEAPIPAMLFGQGFGAKVDLGVFMPLQVSETGFLGVREIGVFHNGYVYLLTKVGLLGLLIYVSVFFYLYRVGRPIAALPRKDMHSTAGRLFQFTIVALLATTYFISGIFNRVDMFPVLLLLGYLTAYRHVTLKG